ncbi:LCP family protein [Clostridium sp. Maddingley MBC34-26]|uniref:LCP family protein n=2 Tax=unclassified Clostridium TaxID=2614128 RepID=UPI00029755B4|nr:LCP family protein [Clostridium sp. Maddingley MBC34-26]EKQ56936.1 MAG: cell envelope-related transcriptional attenuator [Clostridium sp. Maddingley MBC34-26]
MINKINFKKNNMPSNNGISHKNNIMVLKKIGLSILIIMFIVFIVFVLLIFYYLNKINKIDLNTVAINNDSNTEQNVNPVQNNNILTKEKEDSIDNIALFGIDETDGVSGRSDCIMILTIDNNHKELKLSSIIRDSYVNIPTKNKKDKINHAYAFGGPKLALDTLNENFNLNIDKFITVNFSSLPKIIDNVGGITLDISNEELKYINGYIHQLNSLNNTTSPDIVSPGSQLVNGTQALAYCRIRYTAGGDFERSQRHRTVLNKLLEKSKTIPITQYPPLLSEVLPIVQTNLEKADILSLVKDINSLRNQTLLQDRFPYDGDGSGKLISGIYYYVFDEEATTRKLHYFIFEK